MAEGAASLSIAHIDCDAFFAAVEKRDSPDLRGAPLIVGGGHRGVVATACYLARRRGVRSAMPMYQALRLCPEAKVVPPDHARYRKAAGEIRRLMRTVTPLVEAVSIDEAYLGMAGCPAPEDALRGLVQSIVDEVGVTASVGLSCNKLLAKIASDMDKPEGFTVIPGERAVEVLRPMPVRRLPGVGPAMERSLEAAGLRCVGDVAGADPQELFTRFGGVGLRLADFSRGEDWRPLITDSPAKSVSSETTLDRNVAEPDSLQETLREVAEDLAARLGRAGLGGRTVLLKLTTSDFRHLTRSRRLDAPVNEVADLMRVAGALLASVADGRRSYRLVGIAVQDLDAMAEISPLLDLEAEDLRQCRTAAAGEAARQVRC